MKGLALFLCVEILSVLLCGASEPAEDVSDASSNNTDQDGQNLTTTFPALPTNTSAYPPSSASTPRPQKDSQTKTPSNIPTIVTTPSSMFIKRECLQVFMVSGGLIIACAILLISTILLMCRVCQLNRHIKALNSDSELISSSGYWMGTAKENKSKSKDEAKETSMLLADVSQTQEEMGNGTTTKEEGGKDGQTQEETKEKKKKEEEEEVANGEEAATTAAIVEENPPSSSPKSQEEVSESKPTEAEAASTPESTKEPKDVV